MKALSIIAVVCVVLVGNVLAGDVLLDYESRTSGDKTNLFYRTKGFELYALKTSNLELEAGPRFHLGPLIVTTRLGVVWNLADNTVDPFGATNFFFKKGRITALGVFEFKLSGVKRGWAYQEGFFLLDLKDLVSRSSFGFGYEHYRKADGQNVWVLGPRYELTVDKGCFKGLYIWAGVTDNPTATIAFMLDI